MIPLANTYFSGAGLMDLGLEQGGVQVQQCFEIDSLCCETQRQNFGHEVVECDIKLKLVQDEKQCDVMIATYPCNKYSAIGDIHGVRTGDDLFLHFFRHVAIKKPEVYAVENVPGMKKFPVEMEGEDGLTIIIPEIGRCLHDWEWADQEDWNRDLANADLIVIAVNDRDSLLAENERLKEAVRSYFTIDPAERVTEWQRASDELMRLAGLPPEKDQKQ